MEDDSEDGKEGKGRLVSQKRRLGLCHFALIAKLLKAKWFEIIGAKTLNANKQM